MKTEQADFDQPSDVGLEQSLLGHVLLYDTAFDDVCDLVDAEDFIEPLHSQIYTFMKERQADGQTATFPAVRLRLSDSPDNVQYLKTLLNAAGTCLAPREYAQTISEMSVRRKAVSTMREASMELKAGDGSITTIIDRVNGDLDQLNSSKIRRPKVMRAGTAALSAAQRLVKAHEGEVSHVVPTGIDRLDRALGGGFKSGQLILLGGRPGMGKSTVAQCMAHNQATAGFPGFFGSLEMEIEDNLLRMASCSLSKKGIRIPYSSMRGEAMKKEQLGTVVSELGAMQDLCIDFGERQIRDIDAFKRECRRLYAQRMHRGHPLRIIYIDYLQLLQSTRFTKKYDIVSEASDACKSVAMELSVPVVALTQLSRGVEARDTPIPQLSDMRESGKLEEDADAVIFAYRPAYYLTGKIDALPSNKVTQRADLEAELSAKRYDLDLIIAKQRGGKTGTVTTYCDIACSRVEDDKQFLINTGLAEQDQAAFI